MGCSSVCGELVFSYLRYRKNKTLCINISNTLLHSRLAIPCIKYKFGTTFLQWKSNLPCIHVISWSATVKSTNLSLSYVLEPCTATIKWNVLEYWFLNWTVPVHHYYYNHCRICNAYWMASSLLALIHGIDAKPHTSYTIIIMCLLWYRQTQTLNLNQTIQNYYQPILIHFSFFSSWFNKHAEHEWKYSIL